MASRSDVAVAYIAHDGRPCRLGDPSRLTQLERAPRAVALHPVKDGLAVGANELHGLSPDLFGEVVRHFTEKLADGHIELADFTDVRRGGRKNCGNTVPETIGVRDRPMGDEITLEHLVLLEEICEHRLDRVEGSPRDHPDHAHCRPPIRDGHRAGVIVSSCEGRSRPAARLRGD